MLAVISPITFFSSKTFLSTRSIFSFITNQLGKDLRELTYKYIVPFKNTGNLENKIEELENINSQNLSATIQVDENNINDLEENIKNFNKERILISGDKQIFVNARFVCFFNGS